MATKSTSSATTYTTAESNFAQTARGLGIRRNQDTPPSPTFDKLGNFTSLSKADVSVPSYVTTTFAAGSFTARVAGFAQTEFRRKPGDTTLASAQPLAGIPERVADGGQRTYSLIKQYDLKENVQSGEATRWMDLYGRVLEVNGSNIAILNDKAANAEITSTTFSADTASGNETYAKNKGLTYYTKYTGGNKSIGGVEAFSVGKG
jgi:hypothetical protein